MLVAVDASPSGQYASRLVGSPGRCPANGHDGYSFRVRDPPGLSATESSRAERTTTVLKENAEEGVEAGLAEPGSALPAITARIEKPDEEAIAAEAKKGYGLLVIGREPASKGDTFHEQITRSAAEFGGPFAIAIARGVDRQDSRAPRLNILVPVTGTPVSRHGAEFAIALAQASRGYCDCAPCRSRAPSPSLLAAQFGARIAPIAAPKRSSARLSGWAILTASRSKAPSAAVDTPQEAISVSSKVRKSQPSSHGGKPAARRATFLWSGPGNSAGAGGMLGSICRERAAHVCA